MGLLADKWDLDFGIRSWSYSAFIEDGEIIEMFLGPELENNSLAGPFEILDAGTMIEFLPVQATQAA
jgi:peroxiredoxin